MPYVVYRGLTEDSVLLNQVTHLDQDLELGRKLPPDFTAPVEFRIDLTSEGRRMSSLFVLPAFLVHQRLHEALVAVGIDNVDPYPAVIRNQETGQEWDDYLFLNIVGLVACADLANSDYAELGPDINVIDKVAIKADRLPSAHIFRLAEDRLKIVVSDRVHDHLISAGFTDIYFEPVVIL